MKASPSVLAGPIVALPGWDTDTCAFSLSQSWNRSDDFVLIEAAWVGDLDGDGIDDAILASTGDKGEGLVSIVRGGG